LRQYALGRILYSTHTIAQWRMIEGYNRAVCFVGVEFPSDDDVNAAETRFDKGQSHEQS